MPLRFGRAARQSRPARQAGRCRQSARAWRRCGGASYEARRFGVHFAMASVTAKRKCPDLTFVRPRFDTYKQVSLQIRVIFAEFTTLIEPLSLDEAYLNVTENRKEIPFATRVPQEI